MQTRVARLYSREDIRVETQDVAPPAPAKCC